LVVFGRQAHWAVGMAAADILELAFVVADLELRELQSIRRRNHYHPIMALDNAAFS
jgi:hypothetical protein